MYLHRHERLRSKIKKTMLLNNILKLNKIDQVKTKEIITVTMVSFSFD